MERYEHYKQLLESLVILMRNFNASKALSNFDSAQGAGAQAQQRYVKLPATQRRGKRTNATMRYSFESVLYPALLLV